MARLNGDVGAIGKVARILEDLAVRDRRDVIAFISEDGEHTAGLRARAAHRITSALEDLDPAARDRIYTFFAAQLAPTPAQPGDES